MMFKIAASNISRCRHLVNFASKAHYIRGYWPEPITQQTLNQFLKDINYFEEPTRMVNIGLDSSSNNNKIIEHTAPDTSAIGKTNAIENKDLNTTHDLDQVLASLSEDAQIPELNYDDVRLEGDQLIQLAINYGIYRDLFSTYQPNREYINFTQQQAENLNKLVPHYWITDQPFARVKRNLKVPKPLEYFNPIVGISARFVYNSQHSDDEHVHAHTSYYGNIIPAAEANSKPSITIDGKNISDIGEKDIVRESKFDNWTPGQVTFRNFNESNQPFHSLALLNLDYLHEGAANLHWMIANISPSKASGLSNYDEICEYLPVHGINGFGYSRYVFILFQHKHELKSLNKLADFSLESRRFDTRKFMEDNKPSSIVPVGLSWFQTTWDDSSNAIFHNFLKMKAPIYEHVQTKLEARPNEKYPGRVPFNIFLDHLREKKQINEQVLLERLKSIDPTNYKDQYVPPELPETMFRDKSLPSWMNNVAIKKANKISYWRGLRPASAILPLNNNADLDYPIRPTVTSYDAPLGAPNEYKGNKRRLKYKKSSLDRPPHEHESVFVQEGHERYAEEAKKQFRLNK